ncbi:MAG: radical SAM protein [Candidatus Omnitrophota bacterium]|jgi:radical SAM superfamily enzyme YgiQ (UPF0313 family)
MKVLLLNPSYKDGLNKICERYYIRSGSRWPHSGVKIKGMMPHYLPFPFFLAYSASLLKEHGFDVYAIDAVALDIDVDNLLNKIAVINPDIIFYEIVSLTADYDFGLAAKIKNGCRAVIAAGGTHATTFARNIITERGAIDYVLKGEFEHSLLGLAEHLRGDREGFPAGIVFRKDSGVFDTGEPSLADPLDRLPFPLRDIFPANDSPDPSLYWDGFSQLRPAVQMQSSRGCPYRCYFCLWNQVFYGNGRYRSFSPQRVVDEMEEVAVKYKAREVYFDDDNFTADKERIVSLCSEISKRKLGIRWSCMGDTVNLTEELIGNMADSGCIGIKFGIESASDRILKNIGKPVNPKKIKEIVGFCRVSGIKTQAAFIVGLLGETGDDFKRTIDFAEGLDVDSIQVSIATPFPGTAFFDMLKEKEHLEDPGFREYDGKASASVYSGSLNGRQAGKIRSDFLTNWFLRRLFSPSWYLRHYRVFLRTLKGLGPWFISKQLISLLVDEKRQQ